MNNFLEDLMSVQSESYKSQRMERFIIDNILSMKLGYTKDKYGNIYVTKGNADLYPTMVCHVDTVHDINDNAVVMNLENKMFAIDSKTMERYGIGGDDKVGIYITLKLLSVMENFKAVFFKDEEVGCIGSSKAQHNFFDDSTIVLQCDRKNIDDFVNEISGTKLFDNVLLDDIQHILTKYKRNVVSGGMTDVMQIAEKNCVQVANMSCGYYDPHSDNEYIKIDEVELTLQMCYEIFDKTKFKRYTIELDTRYSPPTYMGYNNYGGKYGNYGYGNTYHNHYKKNYNIERNYNVIESDNEYVDDFDDSRFHAHEHIKIEKPCVKCDGEIWFDDYADEFFCMGCHDYVDIDDSDSSYNIEDQNFTNKELQDVDDTLFYAREIKKL